jgi:hypothetical protein
LPEEDLYEPIKTCFLQRFKSAGFKNVHLEITSNGTFSNELKDVLSTRVSFLKKHFAPDICGFIDENDKHKPITIEVKNKRLGFQEIFQAKGYGELVEAKFAFLVSSQPIISPVKEFLGKRESILYFGYPNTKILYISRFNSKLKQIVEQSWFPQSPL